MAIGKMIKSRVKGIKSTVMVLSILGIGSKTNSMVLVLIRHQLALHLKDRGLMVNYKKEIFTQQKERRNIRASLRILSLRDKGLGFCMKMLVTKGTGTMASDMDKERNTTFSPKLPIKVIG